ncbi:MAG: hypothetical protein M1300_04505 [Epsilonproteobacteria bacterium]|nr:hypothetical protein [Campylobacterota bacterium]
MSKDFTRFVSPDRISVDLVTAKEDRAYEEATKGFIHAFVVPFILSWIHPLVATVYLVTAAVLYSTVFRHRSQGFWGVIVLFLAIWLLLVIS